MKATIEIMETINVEELIDFINANCAACFAYENEQDGNVEVTYRAKKNDRVYINLADRTVTTAGRVSTDVVSQIVEFTGFETI